MATISYPTRNIQYFPIAPVYISADDASVLQYLTENGFPTGSTSYVKEDQRFSNDGALAYQYWEYDANLSGNTWKTEYGFRQVVTSLTYA